MCPPIKQNNKHKHFFVEVDSELEYWVKNNLSHTHEHQEFARIRQHHQEELARIRQHHQEELARIRQHHQEELARIRKHHEEELDRIREEVRNRMSGIFREILQIERQLSSNDTPVNIREQLRSRHRELCAHLNIPDDIDDESTEQSKKL